MGPVMNLALALVVMAVVLYQGAQLPAFDQQPVVIGSVTTQLGRRRKPACRPAIASSASTASPSRPGKQFSMAIAAEGQARGHARASSATASRSQRPRDHAARGRASSSRARSASCRSCTRRSSTLNPRRTGAAGRTHSRATSSWRPAASSNVSRERADRADQGARGPAAARSKCKRDGQPYADHGHAAQDRRHRDASARRSAPGRSGPSSPARRGAQAERRANWDWTKLIVKTLVGLFTRETSVKQLMGPVAIGQLSGDAARAGLGRSSSA